MHGVGGPSTGGGGGKGDDLMQVKVFFFQNVVASKRTSRLVARLG